MAVTIRYSPASYSLGSHFLSLSPSIQQQVAFAINSVNIRSEVGKVLSGQNPFYTVVIEKAYAAHGSLDHVNLQLRQISGRTESGIKLYPDGSYQKGNNQVRILGRERPAKNIADIF